MLIKDSEVEYLAVPNRLMRTYFFRPVTEWSCPGVLLYSEIFQVTGPIWRTAAVAGRMTLGG